MVPGVVAGPLVENVRNDGEIVYDPHFRTSFLVTTEEKVRRRAEHDIRKQVLAVHVWQAEQA